MPFIGLGLHVIIALFFAVHVVRSRQNMYWLFVLFSFPLLGSLVYFLVVYWPSNQRMQRHGQKLLSAANNIIDPGREMRQAQEAFDYTPTAQNRMRLAAAQLAAGQSQAAAENYSACLQGPFANDPEIRLGAAQAYIESGQAQRAMEHLQFLQQERPAYQAESVGILQARAWAGLGEDGQARAAFEDLLARFGSFDVHAEYAIWAAQCGDSATAERLRQAIEKITQRWTSAQRELNAAMMRRLMHAYRQMEESARRAR